MDYTQIRVDLLRGDRAMPVKGKVPRWFREPAPEPRGSNWPPSGHIRRIRRAAKSIAFPLQERKSIAAAAYTNKRITLLMKPV